MFGMMNRSAVMRLIVSLSLTWFFGFSATAVAEAKADANAESEATGKSGDVTWNVDNDKTNPPVGNPNAPKGGSIVWADLSQARSLNYPIVGDVLSETAWRLVMEPLADYNERSGEIVPLLAEKWSLSADKKTIMVYLNKKAKYPDGSPVLAEDIKFYFDTVRDPKVLAAAVRSALDQIKDLTVVDKHTIKIEYLKPHFAMIDQMGGLYALKKSYYEGKDYNKDFNKMIMGSGPYEVVEFKKNKHIKFKRRSDYWGAHLNINAGRYNIDNIEFRYVKDDGIRFELLKKGEVDMIRFNKAARWKGETNSEHFKKNWVVARRGNQKRPDGTAGQILNMRRWPFSDVNVRKALAYAWNREKFIKDLFHDNYTALSSYFPGSIYENQELKPVPYDLKKARELLKKAGFTKVNSEGILIDEKGRPLKVTCYYTQKSAERYYTIYKNDLKKIGVDFNLELITWATLTKKMDNFQFDMTGIAWSGTMNPDPKSLYYGKYADEKSSNNYAGVNDPEIDKLIDDMALVFDRAERAKLFHKLDSKLNEISPFILGWYLDHYRIGYANKFGFIEDFIPPYVREWKVYEYAWVDKEKEKALVKARADGKAMASPGDILGPHS